LPNILPFPCFAEISVIDEFDCENSSGKLKTTLSLDELEYEN
jgi:hypothetical protein